MAPLTNAERQKRWREKRDLLAKQASNPVGILHLLEAITPDMLSNMSAGQLERLQDAAHRTARLARQQRERNAATR